jgi:hypothetical protein
MAKSEWNYPDSVFVNCPFDATYEPIRNAIVFAVFDCGFVPRSALDFDDGSDVRFEKIKRLIEESKYGVHDISRTEADPLTQLPRFNMPLELGVFLAARTFGAGKQKQKNCLILDREPYRYRAFVSDISGQDIRSHGGDPIQVITEIRNWLNTASRRKTLPGGRAIIERYARFQSALPQLCVAVEIEPAELTYVDFVRFASTWLRKQSAMAVVATFNT